MPRKAKPKIVSDLKGVPAKPDFIAADDVASNEWDRLVSLLSRLDSLSQVDGGALAIYCGAYSRLVQAQKQLARDGLATVAPNGCQMKSPYIDIAKQAEATMIRILTQFGLTPKAREGIKQKETVQPAATKWAQFDKPNA